MLRKRTEVNYFTLLRDMAVCSFKAAEKLDDLLHNYADVANKANEVHNIEHEGDKLLHNLVKELNRAFITPIDREDILDIGGAIDTITDTIEDVANCFDMFSIQRVEPAALDFSDLVKQTCDTLAKAVGEFELFRSSKKLSELVIEVNHLEEKGDRLYRSTVKALYSDRQMSMLEIIKWKEIYDNMEKILDTCEDVADLLESTAIKNR
ncbi:MAG TPA: DUF47 family protein [Candidatus Atribacteria bacterium]|nr:DUF47 family protein [Candidatus Atribacteria bacterium]HPT77955.1 DUF47 family protein [Candidatus Atribacteria bacterium]